MKKKIFVAAVVAIVAVGAAWNLNLNKESENLSELTLSNVEVLAQEKTGPCAGYGRVLCSYNDYWVKYQL